MHRKIIFVFVLLFIICFCIINTNSFKRFFINSAMTSMNHQYLAYILYDEDTVKEVLANNRIIESGESTDTSVINTELAEDTGVYESIYEKQNKRNCPDRIR